MSNLRRLIADRMAQSARDTAPVTLTTEADATELVRLRETLKADPLTKVTLSYNVLLAKLVSIALLEHRDLNATVEGNEIIRWETVNVGIAVDTERGLVVPVLRNVQAKSLHQLAPEAEELLGRASQGRALPDELTDGTFTITNLGIYEIDTFTPIINLPECAVLGVGRLNRKPVVAAGDTTALRTMLALSLTFDHRLVDGAPAARFLQRVKQFVEQPYLWLTREANL
jgi:pyruvate dehydrogenase E2 component (dihydrolipoamide acetyltransferase)